MFYPAGSKNPDKKHAHRAIQTYVKLKAASHHTIISVCLLLNITAEGGSWQGLLATGKSVASEKT